MICSQRSLTRPAVLASASPKTCGCRRTSFSCTARAAALEVACAALLEQQREEVDLEEEVAELVEELGVVAADRRVGDLVRLLDGVRDDRPDRLLPVPGALAAQPLGELLELEQRLGKRHEVSRASRESASADPRRANP